MLHLRGNIIYQDNTVFVLTQYSYLIFTLCKLLCNGGTPLQQGTTQPLRMATNLLNTLGASQSRPRLFDVGGLCVYDRPSSVVTGFPGSTTETYASHILLPILSYSCGGSNRQTRDRNSSANPRHQRKTHKTWANRENGIK